jgi:hypothetical protein
MTGGAIAPHLVFNQNVTRLSSSNHSLKSSANSIELLGNYTLLLDELARER